MHLFLIQVSRKGQPVSQLPFVNVDSQGDISILAAKDGEVHIYAHPDEPVIVHQQDSISGKVGLILGDPKIQNEFICTKVGYRRPL